MSASVLFLAWQDPASRRWFPIGRLWREAGGFRFGYILGFEAAREAGLEPLPAFPDPTASYASEHLFPLFRNRVMNARRADYPRYLERLGLDPASDPAELDLLILARSRGFRSTDGLEVFPLPLVEAAGERRYRVEFFVHGLRHGPLSSQKRAEALGQGDRLLLLADLQNPKDARAVALRTEDGHLLGYLPRYHAADVQALIGVGASLRCEVLQVNPPPAAPQQRVLCRLDGPWPFERGPLSAPEYTLLAP